MLICIAHFKQLHEAYSTYLPYLDHYSAQEIDAIWAADDCVGAASDCSWVDTWGCDNNDGSVGYYCCCR